MIVQHPLLWCAVLLSAGIALGMNHPHFCYLPMLFVSLLACTLLRRHGNVCLLLTLLIWFLLGCCRASIGPFSSMKPAWQTSLERKAKVVQTALTGRLERSGMSGQTLSLAKALVLGNKDDLDKQTKRSFRQVGASHLLALSGLHLGIIYALIYTLFVRWVCHTRWRWHALPLVLFSLWGYALVAGMPVSLVRAALMLSLLTVVMLMQYRTDPLHPLALSAIVILFICPEELLSISFQLSFAAVFFIVALWQPVGNWFPKANWAEKMVGVSCVATLGTMPLTLFYFHQLPLFGPLLSLVLIPMTTVFIWLVLLVMLLPVAPLAVLPDAVEALQRRIIGFCADIPHATLSDVQLSPVLVGMIYAVMLLAIVRLRTQEE